MLRRDSLLGFCFFALLFAASESVASSWTCRHGDLARHVTVFYPDAPARLPCKVYYSKPTEDALPRPLWRSQNEEGYCERKAEELVERLRGWEWHCSENPGDELVKPGPTSSTKPSASE